MLQQVLDEIKKTAQGTVIIKTIEGDFSQIDICDFIRQE